MLQLRIIRINNDGMIICLCNAINDKMLEGAIASGVGSVCDVFRQAGCRPQCGKCVPEIRETLQGRQRDVK